MIFGYDDKIKFFKGLIEKDDLSHAYLFYGEPEIGKATFAKFLAGFLEDKKENDNSPLLDALFVEAEEGKTLGIDDVFRIQEFLYQRPLLSKKRTVVVCDAEDLTREAQGALLKIVEEPPRTALIIFVTQDKRNLFEALSSRVEKIYFPTLPSAEIEKGLMSLRGLDETKASRVAKVAFGRFGRALGLIEGAINSGSEEENVESELSSAILRLYAGGIKGNVRILSWLLQRQMFIMRYKRYNLNMKLQKKAIDAALGK